jgi:uncharacterized glyoxalase superfamily protein PhnB
MLNELSAVAIHVPNVWQACEWYRQVFGFTAEIAPSGIIAHVEASGRVLAFTSHQAQEQTLGIRRRNSFVSDPPAFHLDIFTADVQALFNHALACGAVPVLEPTSDIHDHAQASLRDLNGILIRLLCNTPQA